MSLTLLAEVCEYLRRNIHSSYFWQCIQRRSSPAFLHPKIRPQPEHFLISTIFSLLFSFPFFNPPLITDFSEAMTANFFDNFMRVSIFVIFLLANRTNLTINCFHQNLLSSHHKKSIKPTTIAISKLIAKAIASPPYFK